MGYSVGSLFAGIGGICIGFHQAGFKINWANEYDQKACETYRHNINVIDPDVKLFEKDILEFTPPSDKIDVLAGGFPCQPFSLAGNRLGKNDPRGKMFFEMIKIAEKCNYPRAIFMENVSNLKTIHEHSFYDEMIETLHESGYKYVWDQIMNTKDYSKIPQFRNRIYFVAFRDKNDFTEFSKNPFQKVDRQPEINDIIDRSIRAPDYSYYGDHNAKHFDVFERDITKTDTTYQYRRIIVRENMNKLCPTLTASMGIGGHNVPLIKDDFGIRKLTPEECLKLQGFPEDYSFIENMSNMHKYKQIGNSVTVPIVKMIAERIMDSFQAVDEARVTFSFHIHEACHESE